MDRQDISLEMVAMFKALGDPTRLRIFEFLRSCSSAVAIDDTGEARPVSGPTVGEVCCTVTGAERINSKVSHHLKELRLAGLITIERHGKNMICSVNSSAVPKLRAYFSRNEQDNNGICCALQPEKQEEQELCQTKT
jgi:ArsR family transcriptional regulator